MKKNVPPRDFRGTTRGVARLDRGAMSALAGPSAVLRRRPDGGTSETPADDRMSSSGAHLAEGQTLRSSDGASSAADDVHDGAEASRAGVRGQPDANPAKAPPGRRVPTTAGSLGVPKPRVPRNADPARLRVCAVTWNMCNRKFPRDLAPMLAPLREDDGHVRCDVLVVGVQEAPALDGFVELLLDALGGDDAFVHLAGVSLDPGGWIRMDAFARRELLPMVRDVRRDAVSCGLGNVIGNKGAVGVSFEYAGARMCFLNAHLAAHAENVAQRNADYHRVVKTMFAPRGREKGKPRLVKKQAAGKVKKNAVAPAPAFAEDVPGDSPIDSARPTPSTPKFGGVFKRRGWSAADGFDMCVFLGDLNYRVEGNRRAVDVLLERGMLDVMRANDQLRIERSAGRAFAGWSEGEIEFPPTYKVDRGTANTYDTSKKQRVPSWTDRVMWRTAGGGAVTCPDGADVYTSVKGVLTSDHLPVVARIEAQVRGARDAAPGDGTHARAGGGRGMCAVM